MSEMAAALFVMFDKQIENSKKKTLSPEELDSEIDKFLKNFPFENLSEDDKEAFCRLARNKITVSIEPGVTLVDANTSNPRVGDTRQKLAKKRYYWNS